MRLSQFSASVGGSGPRTYTAIAVSNAGGYSWGWYQSLTAAQVLDRIKPGDAFLADLDPNDDGTFNAIFYGTGRKHWFHPDRTVDEILLKAAHHGARVVDLTPYTINGVTRYAAVMVDNISGLSGQVRDVLDGKVASGDYGFRMAEFGGSTVAALRGGARFEPASSIKILYHLDLMRDLRSKDTTTGPVDLSKINIDFPYASDPDPRSKAATETGVCTDSMSKKASTDLNVADLRMLLASDNRMSTAIATRLGGSAAILDRVRPAVNLLDTSFGQPVIGCQTADHPNRSSLPDLAKIWEAGAARTDVLDARYRTAFKDGAIKEASSGTTSDLDPVGLCDISNAEAAKLGKGVLVKSLFCNGLKGYYKGGIVTDSAANGSTSLAGIVFIPFKDPSGTVVPRIYTYGYFFNDFTHASSSLEGELHTLGRTALHIPMRQLIHDALLTW